MNFVDQRTGKPIRLDPTPELNRELQAYYDRECKHVRTELRQRVVVGGAIQRRLQCLDCGQRRGNSQKVGAGVQLPEDDPNLEKAYKQNRSKELHAIHQKHFEIQSNSKDAFRRRYEAYLGSENWQQKRALVFERAGGRCEGCRVVAPTQVHHLTYGHVFDELLFELVAVCEDCHAKAHRDRELPTEDDDTIEFDESEPF